MRNPMTVSLMALALLVVPLLASAQARGSNARSDVVDMDEKDRALVAKEIVKQNKQQKNGGKSGSSAGCGQVDIGNDSDKKKGSGQIAERQKTVIVTGNVINTANCK